MSWQLGSFTVLALALAAGFGWYERGRPDARVLALVATLAALAALGRIAFAALPNVKPTTDIVLISGFTLGGAPGFAVGAIAGLASNFFFGQGPWTPWQMAAWGATGMVGAGLAHLTRGRLGRWPLAIVCAVCGYAFAVIQDVGDWVNFSDHSVAQLAVYVGRGTGFDLIHAAGCLLFALALGPALMASISRFTARLSVSWLPAGGISIVLALAGALALGAAAAGPSPARADASPETYLLAAENSDGGLGAAPGAASDPLFAGWGALGLMAAGETPGAVRHGGATLLGYLEASAAHLPDVGAVERTILVAGGAGLPASDFGGQDLVATLERHIRADGSVGEQVNLTAFAILALRAAHVAVPSRIPGWLASQAGGDGGFSFARRGGTSDVDDTGAALEALRTGSAESARGVRFIRAQQNHDGGFPSQPGGDSNAQSTAWAIQGLIAAGVDPAGLRSGGRSPFDYLHGLIASDGHVRYSRGSDQTPVWVTAQALMALTRKPLPLEPPPPAPGPVTPARHGARRTRRHHAPARRKVKPSAPRARASASTIRHLGQLAAIAGLLEGLAYAPIGL